MCDNDHVPNLMATDNNDEKEEERLFAINHSYLRNLSTEIVIQLGEAKRAQTFEEIVPEAYHEFKDVFDKKTFESYLPEDLGIMPSNSFQETTRSTVKRTTWLTRNKKSLMNSWRKT